MYSEISYDFVFIPIMKNFETNCKKDLIKRVPRLGWTDLNGFCQLLLCGLVILKNEQRARGPNLLINHKQNISANTAFDEVEYKFVDPRITETKNKSEFFAAFKSLCLN